MGLQDMARHVGDGRGKEGILERRKVKVEDYVSSCELANRGRREQGHLHARSWPACCPGSWVMDKRAAAAALSPISERWAASGHVWSVHVSSLLAQAVLSHFPVMVHWLSQQLSIEMQSSSVPRQLWAKLECASWAYQVCWYGFEKDVAKLRASMTLPPMSMGKSKWEGMARPGHPVGMAAGARCGRYWEPL